MSLVETFAMWVMRNVQKKKPPIVDISTRALKFLEAGDVLLFRGAKNDLLSAGICVFTYSPYAHAELYVTDGWSIGAEENGISYNDSIVTGIDHRTSGPAWIDVFRYKGGLSPRQKMDLVDEDKAQLGKPYGILPGIVEFAWPSRKEYAARSAYASFGCSMLVSFCYQQIGLPLSPSPAPLVAPADLGRSSKLEYQFSVYKGRKEDRSQYVNKEDPEVQPGKWNWLSNLFEKLIVEPTSSRREFYKALANCRGKKKGRQAIPQSGTP